MSDCDAALVSDGGDTDGGGAEEMLDVEQLDMDEAVALQAPHAMSRTIGLLSATAFIGLP